MQPFFSNELVLGVPAITMPIAAGVMMAAGFVVMRRIVAIEV
jgi:hypothetical protein